MKVVLTMRTGKKVVLNEMPVRIEISHGCGSRQVELPSIDIDIYNPIIISGDNYGILVSNRNPDSFYAGITLMSKYNGHWIDGPWMGKAS